MYPKYDDFDSPGGGPPSLLKYLMFFFNILFLCGGIAVLAIGIWCLVDYAKFTELVGTDIYETSAYILIASGVIVIVIAFFGCFGAIKEIKCLLLAFFVLLLLIFIIELISAILFFAFRDKIKDAMKNVMYDTALRIYDEKDKGPATDSWNLIQAKLQCCGVEGDNESAWGIWRRSHWYSTYQGPDIDKPLVPQTCCKINSEGEFTNVDICQATGSAQTDNTRPPLAATGENPHLYVMGCYDKAAGFLSTQAAVIGASALGIACIQILGMVFAMTLYRRID